MKHSLKIYKELDDQLLQQWEKLWSSSPSAHIFNSPKWFISCVSVFQPKQIMILVCESDEKVHGVMPFISEKYVLAPVWDNPKGDYLDKSSMLVQDNCPECFDGFITHMQKEGSWLLRELPIWASTAMHEKKSGFIIKESINPFVELSNDPLSCMRSPSRNKMKKAKRVYGENLSFKMFTRNVSSLLPLVYEIEEDSFKWVEEKAMFKNPAARKLYEKLAKTFSDSMWIGVLYYKEVPISSMLGFVYNDTFLAVHTSYRKEYVRMMPGKTSVWYLIEDLQKRGIRILDFSRGDQRYKSLFTDRVVIQKSICMSSSAVVKSYIHTLANSQNAVYRWFSNHRKVALRARKIAAALKST